MKNALEVFRARSPFNGALNDFDELFQRAWLEPFAVFSEPRPVNREWFEPRVDVSEDENTYFVSMDLPGLKQEDIKIDLHENVLKVSGERKRELTNEGKGVHRLERTYGKFQRNFTLPATVDVEKVEAHMENGVLQILLPKAELAKPKTIEIKSR